MVIKKIKDRKKREAAGTAAYIADSKRAALGETLGPKVEFSGILNCLSEDWAGAVNEIEALCGAYKAEGATSAHWVISLQHGEKFTQETAQDAVQTTLKNLGMEGHPCTWAVHNDKANHHVHMCFSRVAPEPDASGEYHIVWKGATIQSPKGNNELASGHAALAELCHRHGWKPEQNARYVWKDGQAVRNRHATDPAQADQIKLGQRIETWEARAGVKHPKRIMAETAMQVIRESGNDKPAAISALAAQGIIYSDVDYLDNKGRRHVGGKLTGLGGEEVKISALPKDCRWISKAPATTAQPPINTEKGAQIYAQIVTFGAAKKYIRQIVAESKTGTEMFQKLAEKNLIFEQTGKTGGRIRFGKQPADVIKLSECGTSFSQLQQKFNDFPAYENNLHGSQVKVNGNSRNINGNGGKDAAIHHENTIAAQARAVFAQAKTTEEMQKMLKEHGIAFTREIATDRKTARNFEFGKLQRAGEAITLKALGENAQGKALFTLSGIDRVFLARDAAQVLTQAKSWSEAETSLADVGISYSRVKTTSGDKEIIVGRLERNGITSNTGLAGKEFQPAVLDARFLPYAQARAFYEGVRLEKNPVAALHRQGLTVSDIDRVGRVGERLEPSLKKQDKQPKAQGPQSQAPRPEKSIIPRSITEILDLIEESAQQAAALAAANAAAGRAAWEARAAENRAQAAEKALQDLRASIKTETPAPVAAAKEKTMADSTHTPTATVQAGGNMEKERIQNAEKIMQERERELEKEKQRMQREREKAHQRQ